MFRLNSDVNEDRPNVLETNNLPKNERLTADDMDNLRHMLGVSAKHPRGYRNYFVAGGDDVPSMERLRAHGLVVRNEQYRMSSGPCYHATETGARFLGLERLPK